MPCHGDHNEDGGLGFADDLDTRREEQIKVPRMFSVIMLNDDFTPMEFVIDILVRHFGKEPEVAVAIMMEVHEKGKGIAGVYTREMAETKIVKVLDEARKEGYPFMMTMQPN